MKKRRKSPNRILCNKTLLVFLVVIVSAAGFLGWRVYKNNINAKADSSSIVQNKYFSNCPPELAKRPQLKIDAKDSKNTDANTNKCVYALQYYLKNAASLDITVDGWFGPQTDKRIKEFQKKYSIAKDGEASYGTATAATWQKLESLHKELAEKLKKEYKDPLAVWTGANIEDPNNGENGTIGLVGGYKYSKPLIIGASHTVGIVRLGKLEEKLKTAGISAQINAKSGRTTVKGKSSAKIALQTERSKGYSPDLLMVLTGVNDLGWSNQADPTADYTKWINEMMDEIDTKNKIPVIWFTVTTKKNPKKAAFFNQALRDVQKSRTNLILMDWVPSITANPKWYVSDGVHYNKDGYLFRADCTVRALKLVAEPKVSKILTCN